MKVRGSIGRHNGPGLVDDLEQFLSCIIRVIDVSDPAGIDDTTRKQEHSRNGPFSKSARFYSHSRNSLSVELQLPSRAGNTHLLEMLQGRRADDNRVAMLALEETVVREPTQGDFRERQFVLLRDLLDGSERAEVRLVPVSPAEGLLA